MPAHSAAAISSPRRPVPPPFGSTLPCAHPGCDSPQSDRRRASVGLRRHDAELRHHAALDQIFADMKYAGLEQSS